MARYPREGQTRAAPHPCATLLGTGHPPELEMELAVLEEGQVSRGAGEVEALLPAGPVLVASSAVRRKKPCCRAPSGLMRAAGSYSCLLYTSDAADDWLVV